MTSRGALLMAACLALPGAAQGADWGPPVVLADNGFVGGITALPSGGFLATSRPFGAENLRLTTLGTGSPPAHADLSLLTGDTRRAQATAGDGTSVVAAVGSDPGDPARRLSVVLRAPDGTVAAPETFAVADTGTLLSAAGAPDGTLAVAWTEHFDGRTEHPDRLVVRVRPPGGAFGPEQIVFEDRPPEIHHSRMVEAASMAFASDGRLLIAALRHTYPYYDGVIELFEGVPGAGAFASTYLGQYSGTGSLEIVVAAGAAGEVVAWTVPNSRGRYVRSFDVIARRRPAGVSEFAAPERLARTDVDAPPSVDVVVPPDGRAAVLLAAARPRTPAQVSRPQPPRRIIRIAEAASGLGAFAPAVAISRRQGAGNAVRDSANPALTTDARGNLLAAWTSTCTSCDSKVVAALRPAGGAWSPPTALNDLGLYASAPRIALDPAGQAAITWHDQHPERGTTVAVAAIGSGLLEEPPDPGDRTAPPLRAVVDASAADILRRRRAPVRVTCGEACYANVSYGPPESLGGSGAALAAGATRRLVVRLPRTGYSKADLRRHVARGLRLLRVTAGDAQGNLRQQRLGLTGG